MTNDAALLLPTMAAILVAKWTGDYITRPLYHALLDFKSIPYLDYEPIVYDEHLNPWVLETNFRNTRRSPLLSSYLRSVFCV